MLCHYSLILLFLLPLLNLPLELHIISLLYLLRKSFFLHLQLFLSRYFILHIVSIDFISLLRDCRLDVPLLHLLIKRKRIRNIIFLLLLFHLKLSLRVLPFLYFDIIKIICLISLCFVLIILLHKLVVQLSSLLIRRLILTQLDKILLPRQLLPIKLLILQLRKWLIIHFLHLLFRTLLQLLRMQIALQLRLIINLSYPISLKSFLFLLH